MGAMDGPHHPWLSIASGWHRREAKCGRIDASSACADVRYFFLETWVAWAVAARAV